MLEAAIGLAAAATVGLVTLVEGVAIIRRRREPAIVADHAVDLREVR